MLDLLDPYSTYYTQREYKNFSEHIEGKFGGIGIQITLDTKRKLPRVITPLEGTPASRAGILPGDLITKVDRVSTKGLSLQEVVERIRGKPGTSVELKILRGDREFGCTLLRQLIQVPQVKGRVLNRNGKKIGYLRIASFSSGLMDSFEDVLGRLQRDGIQAVLLDLRFNGGGLLSSCVKLADRFLDKGIIVKTVGRRAEDNVVYMARKGALSYPLGVLINGGSASASEVFAGAIKDNARGILIGTRTFGKGSVQTVFTFEDETALRITTATYFTPSGRCIDRILNEKIGSKEYGILPDVVVELSTQEEANLLKVLSGFKLEGFVDKQLLKAVEVLCLKIP
jgi:carboxyl-terminal processing protease